MADNNEPSELVTQPDPVDQPTLADALTTEAKRKPWPKRLWYALTGTRKRTALTITALLVVLAAIIALTPLKYPLLGGIIRSNIDIIVSDAVTGQVLPGAKVNLAGANGTTDKLGTAHFTGLHAGSATLTITKSAYAESTSNFTLGFGDNTSRSLKITSKGIRISFNFTDYVTGQPVAGAQVKLADADVIASSTGQAIASITPTGNEGQTLTAAVTLDGYNDFTVPVKITPGAPAVAAALVPAGHVYYLSNRSGKVDLYQANLDASSPSIILPGTGNEDGSTGILPNVYDPTVLALVSSRAGVRVGGQVREDLYVYHTDTKQLTMVDTGINYSQYRTWLGKTLVYQKYGVNNTTTATTVEAYTPSTNKHATISACTGDGACPTALYATDDILLFSLSGAPSNSSSNGLFAVKSGSTSAQNISKTPGASAVRQTKNTLLTEYGSYNSGQYVDQWQSLDLTTTKVTPLATGPANNTSRTYVDSPGDKLSVSVDKRDGQSDLYLTDESGANEHQLTTTGKVSEFVQWFGDDYVVYSEANQLFVVGVAGGTPKKITNFYSGNVLGYGGGYNPAYQ